MRIFFLSSTCSDDNVDIVSSSVIAALSEQGLSVGYFCPLTGVTSTTKNRGSNALVSMESLAFDKTVEQISSGRKADILEVIVEKVEQLSSGNTLDVIVVEGVEHSPRTIFAAQFNADVANALNAQTVLIATPLADSFKELYRRVQLASLAYGGMGSDDILGVLLTQVDDSENISTEFAAITQTAGMNCHLIGVVPQYVDSIYLKQQLLVPRASKMSPAMFRNNLIQRAAKAAKRIVLPEGDEPRTVQAAIICHQKGIAKCVLLAEKKSIEAVVKQYGLSLPDDIEIIEPNAEVINQYVPSMVERRKSRGLTAEDAQKQLQDTVVLGTMMLADDHVDGLVSGAVHTTANTVRPAFQLIKTRPGAGIASSVFFMLLPEDVVVYGDCAINPNPTAEQLAIIAIQSAESALNFGIEPKVAMISYSTGTSGMGDDVELVKEATTIAQKNRPDLLIEGPLQYDAASVSSVANKKAADSKIAGQANVFIFPDLNTGNTTYKAVQRSADIVSIGPMLQGLNKPVNDLSRGALVDDIVYTIALTAIQSV